MTAEVIEAPGRPAPTATPPHPLREFWGYFSANHGAVAGLVVIVAVVLARSSPMSSRRIRPTSPTPPSLLKPPFWQEGGSLPIRSAPTRSAATSSRA